MVNLSKVPTKNEADLKDGSKIVNTLTGDTQVNKGGDFVTKKLCKTTTILIEYRN